MSSRPSKRAVAAKRLLDFASAALGLSVAAPLVLLGAAAMRLDSPGPWLVRRVRRDVRGGTRRTFELRTERADGSATPVGAAIRRLGIDQVPALWNVLIGEMSLVGPRRRTPGGVDRIGDRQRLRLSMRPGLVGPWALPSEPPQSVEDLLELDRAYIEGWTLRRDLSILASVLAGRPPLV